MENVIQPSDRWMLKRDKELLEKYISENREDIEYRLWWGELLGMLIKKPSHEQSKLRDSEKRMD